MHCSYYDAHRCRSCTWLERAYADQLAAKQAHCRELLAHHGDMAWLPPVESAREGFRNKAKMVIGGSVEAPTLGILDADHAGIDLRACPLYPPALTAAFPVVAEFISRARIAPYHVGQRRGEGKFLIATVAPHSGELMLRFVLRSTEAVERMRKQLPWLQAALPGLRVLSANIQPVPMAVLEGEREIVLGPDDSLAMELNGLPLHLRPQGFFQTNTGVAAALYRQVRDWVEEAGPEALWDLYCGVGGFALHCAGEGRPVTGVEASAEAVASAFRSRSELGLPAEGPSAVRFIAADALEYVRSAPATPGMVVVNPPRRGIGRPLAELLEGSTSRWMVYSSCNAESLARDLAAMPSWRPLRARLLDMFPHTPHYELVVLLENRGGAAPRA